MTESAVSNLPANHELVSVRHYEAGPPAGLELVEPGETFATTKEEEWVSKKKTELTTTRQIETRVKRQVVLEDGKVVEDTGPIVTTNTSEDTEKQEHSQTELRKTGGDEPDSAAAIEGPSAEGQEGWVSVPNPDGVVREVKERRVVSREETEQLRETEDVQHLGDITDEDFLAAVHSGEPDLRAVLREKSADNRTLVSTGPRLLHESTKTHKVTDTEDTAAVSSVRPDGKIVTETTRTTEHEEVKDEDLPDGQPDVNKLTENSQRYQKTKDQEFVEYLADGVKIGQEMRYKAETMEGERHGDGLDDPQDWDSLSTRIRKARRQQVGSRGHLQKSKGIEEHQIGPPLDRNDALTKKPLDFDEEEETRKAETSKWLEHHFGSESTRSSRDSIDDIEPAPSKSFFNVTIKSQPTRVEPVIASKPYVATVNTSPKMYSVSPEPERNTPVRNGYFQGISEWSERRHEEYERYRGSPYNGNGYVDRTPSRASPVQRQPVYRVRDDEEASVPTPPERKRALERRQRSSQDSNRYDSGYRTHSRNEMSRDSHDEPQDEPPPDYSPPPPQRTPTPPSPPPAPVLNKKAYQRTRFAADPSPPPQQQQQQQPSQPKAKHGNIIGQSIRKLVGKIRSASAERKAKQRAKRSPSPQTTYQQYNVIDNIPSSTRRGREAEPVMTESRQQRRGHSPVQRYYLGEDPFGGSIYGRENKYDGARPVRGSAKHRANKRAAAGHPSEDEARSHSTLGRFSKSTGKLAGHESIDYSRSVQTLPRNIRTETSGSRAHTSNRLATNGHTDNTINVSFINTVSPNRPLVNGGPAKPARTYKSNLARSKSFNVHAAAPNGNMYKSNPQLHRLDENPIGLKSPGIVSSISRSTRDLPEAAEENRAEHSYTSRYIKNGYAESGDNKKIFLKGLKERAPDLYKTLQSDDEEHSRKAWQAPAAYSTPVKSRIATYNHGDMYEPPTRLAPSDSYLSSTPHSVVRRGSNNSTDGYSETYHVTTRNDDPQRPSVTNTVQTFSKKTVPSKDGRKMQTIESTETKTITRSRYRGEPVSNMKYLENGGKLSNSSNGGVIIEVKNYRN